MASFDQFYISICYESKKTKSRHCTSVTEQLSLLSKLTPLCLKKEMPAIFSPGTAEFKPSIFQEMRQKSEKAQTYLLRIALYCQKHPSVIDQIESCCSHYLLTASNISIENYLASCRKWISQLELPEDDPLYALLMEGFCRYSKIPKLMTWYYLDSCTDSVFSLSAIYRAYTESLKCASPVTSAPDNASLSRLADLIHNMRAYFDALGNMKKEGPFENLLFDCCEIINLSSSLKAASSGPLQSLLHQVESAARSAADYLRTSPDDAESSLKQLLTLERSIRSRLEIPVIPTLF